MLTIASHTKFDLIPSYIQFSFFYFNYILKIPLSCSVHSGNEISIVIISLFEIGVKFNRFYLFFYLFLLLEKFKFDNYECV